MILASKPWGFPLQEVTIPVHLWHGEEDRSTPIAMARAMAAAIPNCRTTYLPGEGHLFLFDRWGEILGICCLSQRVTRPDGFGWKGWG